MKQFLTDVFFGDLDMLLLDMPPGTGDIAISVGQLLPHAEVIVVTTPQAAASDVAVRSGVVARQTGQTRRGRHREHGGDWFSPTARCSSSSAPAGASASRMLSRRMARAVPLLASIPLSASLREDADAGIPVVIAHPDDPAARAITALAAAIASQPRGLSGRSLPLRPR